MQILFDRCGWSGVYEKSVITQLTEIFDHEPQWLIDQFERHKNEINAEKLMTKRE